MDNKFKYLDKESYEATIFMFGWKMHRYIMEKKNHHREIDDKYVNMMDACIDNINEFMDVYKNKNYVDGHLYDRMRICIEKNML